jgi:hypothetical protein
LEVVEWTHSDGCAIGLDDSFFPVLLLTWEGPADPTTAAAMESFIERQLQRAATEGVRPIAIHNALAAAKPAPGMRDVFVAIGRRLRDKSAEARMKSIMVLDSVVIRTMMSAALFVVGSSARTRVSSSIPRAIDFAMQLLDAEGIPRPKGLHPDRYRPPASDAPLLADSPPA